MPVTRKKQDDKRPPLRARHPSGDPVRRTPRKLTPKDGAGMTPGARLQTAIELLAQIDGARGAADDIVGGYFRGHRFAGAKDRAAISEHIYAVLRHRAALDWWLAELGADIATATPEYRARRRLFTALMLVQGWRLDDIKEHCDGDRFRPPSFDATEQRVLRALIGRTLEHPEMPDPVRFNYPAWLDATFQAVFGADLRREMTALQAGAALDLRANRLKGTREQALAALKSEGIEAEPTPLAPNGLRVHGRIPLSSLACFKEGLIEVQDEGSQIAAALAAVKPGMRVVDFCAGAGGKTLALAADMANRGHLIACDISGARLERSAQRLRRAGVSNVERRALTSERDKWVKRHAESFDRVFVDAPCTGTGTWRRNPDAKWRLTPTDIEELTVLQASILDSAARLAKTGGRVIYATCSLLPAENAELVAGFLARHPEFRLVPVAQAWEEAIGGTCPVEGETLRLTPARHGTDGFFAAVLERQAKSTPEPDEAAAETQA